MKRGQKCKRCATRMQARSTCREVLDAGCYINLKKQKRRLWMSSNWYLWSILQYRDYYANINTMRLYYYWIRSITKNIVHIMMDGLFLQCISWESRFERLDLSNYHFTWVNSLQNHQLIKCIFEDVFLVVWIECY